MTYKEKDKVVENVEIRGEVLLKWTGNPWKARPKKLTILLLIFMFLHLFLIWAAPELGFFLVVFPLLLIGSAIDHLVPTKYTITSEGIYLKNISSQLFKPWSDVKAYIFEEEMGELFFVINTFRSRFQSNMPIYYNNNMNQIEDMVKKQSKLSKCKEFLEEVN